MKPASARPKRRADPLLHIFRIGARFHDAGQVTFDICHEHRYAHITERFCHDLQGDCFTCTGRAGDQSVAVGLAGQQAYLFAGIRISEPD